MVDGLVDVGTYPDTWTFFYMLKAFSMEVEFDHILFKDRSFAPYKWIQTCISFDFVKSNVTLVVNSKEISKGKIDVETKPEFLNMTLENTMMSIRVTKLNVFSTVLSRDLMKHVTNAESPECRRSGDILRWENSSEAWVLNLKGTATKERMFGPCQRESTVTIFAHPNAFPKPTDCMEHCKKLGSRSPPVRTLQEWQNLIIEVSLLATEADLRTDLWLPIKMDSNTEDEQSSGVWRDYYTEEPLDNYTKPWQDCKNKGPFVKVTLNENGSNVWQWNSKGEAEAGCVCQKTVLKLRGLCKTSKLKGRNKVRGYQYIPQQNTKLPVDSFFAGEISTKIAIENHKWKLTVANSDAYAISDVPENTYALGKHTWSIFNDQRHNGSYKAKLTFSGCEEFTCDDGQCVTMAQRCDQIPNCEDGSDEKGCQLIVLNEGYNKDVPPFKMVNYTNGKTCPVEVNITIELFHVLSIDEVDNTIDMQFDIKLEWFDHRLTYNNLKENRYFLNALNSTDLEKIWLPLLVYQNTDQFETTKLGWINEWSTDVLIFRNGIFTR